MAISIAMCTFNGARFLDEQVASIAAQTLAPAELVVCDDSSEDGTQAILRDWAGRLPFPIRIHVNAERLGSTRNFEKAIALCSGDIIALSDQDDVWRPDKLALLQQRFDADDGLGAVFSDAEVVDEALRPLGFGMFEHDRFFERERRILRSPAPFEWMLTHTFVPGMTLGFRSKYRELVLPIPTEDRFLIHDRWIVLAIGAVARVDFIEQQLVQYRQHGSQQIGAARMLGSAGPAAAPSRAERAAHYRMGVATLKELEARAGAFAEGHLRPEARAAILSNLRHLEARAAMPEQRWRRLPTTIRELGSRRYARHSRGLFSALKDLLD